MWLMIVRDVGVNICLVIRMYHKMELRATWRLTQTRVSFKSTVITLKALTKTMKSMLPRSQFNGLVFQLQAHGLGT